MKKTTLLSVILSLFTVFSAAALDAKVVSVTGKAEYSDGSTWTKITEGTVLGAGTVIQTGCKSAVVLSAGSTTLNVGALSRISIEKLTETQAQNGTTREVSDFKLETGSVRSKTRRTDTRKVGHTVTGAVATASVRGTEYFLINTYRGTKINTKEGRVAVWNNKAVKKLHETSDVDPDLIKETDTKLTAMDITNFAPAGAGVIGQGQTAIFASDGSTKNAQTISKDNIKKLPAYQTGEAELPASGSGSAVNSLEAIFTIN